MNKENYSVIPITRSDAYPWIMKKHYAHRMPSVSHVYGLYNEMKLCGCVTFGRIANYIEDKAWEPFHVLELNRLIGDDKNPKNAMSYLIGRAFKLLPKPTVLISYADFRQGHVGYIYQATNWIYTGIGGEGQNIYIMKDGSEVHQRHEKTINMNRVDRVEKTSGKARYYYFIGSRKEKKEMMEMLRFPILPYPKGESKKYDTSFQPQTQQRLFV